MSISFNAGLRQYLLSTCNEFNKDLIAWFLNELPTGVEWQGNIRTDLGKAMKRDDGSKYRTHDGIDFWNIRHPHNAKDKPNWEYDPGWQFPPEVYLQEVGTTGFTRSGNQAYGIDLDSVWGHGKGLTDERLQQIYIALEPIDYVELRRSTQGKGIHARIHATGVEETNHAEHQARGRALLGQLCLDAGLDFVADCDVVGGNIWFHSRRATDSNRGFELLKPAKRILTPADMPPNWPDHLDVVRKKRNRVRVLGGDEDQCAEWSQNVAMDDEHKRIIEEYKKTGYILIYNPDLKMWHGHTAALAKVFKVLKLKGFYETDTKDTDPTTPNCYFFLRPRGVLFVVRLNSQTEHWSWGHTDTEKREACCYYNTPIDLHTACKAVGGVWMGDACTCHNLEQATKLAEMFGYKLPPLANDRPINFKYADGHTILAETVQVKGETIKDWGIGYRKLATTFEAECQPTRNDYDSVARHVVTEKENAGWFMRTDDGEWNCENKDTVLDRVCDEFDIKPKMRPYIAGRIAATPYLLVNEPYSPEFLPGRKMNKFGAQLSVAPTGGGNHPHFDKILRHVGQGIDKEVKNDLWCQQNGITSGYDFILLWCALLIKMPKQHLPMLYLYSRERDNGKSALYRALRLLFLRGCVEGTLALNEKFNKLLAGATLCYLDEERVSAASAQKVKLYIDADEMSMRLMRTDSFMFPNYTHWIACYNFTDGVYVEDGDERIIMIEVPTLFSEDKLDWNTVMLPALESEKADFLGTLTDLELPPSGSRLFLPILSTPLKEKVMAENRTNTPCDRKELLDKVVEKITEKKQFSGPSKELVKLLGSGSWDHSRNHLRRYLREIEPELAKNNIKADLSDNRLIVLELAV
ncbi:MAG TPA: primase-helicase family protein [Thermoguttaceae bacterium]